MKWVDKKTQHIWEEPTCVNEIYQEKQTATSCIRQMMVGAGLLDLVDGLALLTAL